MIIWVTVFIPPGGDHRVYFSVNVIGIQGEIVMSNPNDGNKAIIAEFRANGGQLGGRFAGMPLLLLHTTGAKSQQPRVNTLSTA